MQVFGRYAVNVCVCGMKGFGVLMLLLARVGSCAVV